jgi:uncharacterized protein (TIGR02145 family)
MSSEKMFKFHCNSIFSFSLVFFLSMLLASFSLVNAQQTGRAQGATAVVVIPPPDEAHASHEIGICGTKHFEPRLEFCDSRNNRVYRYVKIGTQNWMAENLDYGKMVLGNEDQTQPGEKYCLHDMGSDCAALYQWAEAMGVDSSFNTKAANLKGKVQGICPSGWHIPSSSEWDTLLAFVDKEQGKENEAATLMYYSRDDNFKWKTNTDPDSMMPRDKYGFEVVSTGQRVLKAQCPVGVGNTTYFCNAHDTAMFWTSDEASSGDPTIATGMNFTEDVSSVGKMPMSMGGAGGPGVPVGPVAHKEDQEARCPK